MMTTAATPKYLVEFPDYGALDVTIPDGFVDASWRNEMCPCWIDEGRHLRLMIDYADPDKSEVAGLVTREEYRRFFVMRLTDDNQIDDTCEQSDFRTFDEALAAIEGAR